ncbi:MAG: ChaN family lipoprotein, partial [Planctomycetota bacterium]
MTVAVLSAAVAAADTAEPCHALGTFDVSPELAADIEGAQIVLVGEVHDNPHHHCVQAAVSEHVGARALVFEMLTPELADAFDPTLDDAGLDSALAWSERGWPPLSIYAPVFARARSGAATVHGAAVERSATRLAYAEGAAAAFSGDAAAFGLTEALPDEQQQQRQTLQFEAHCGAIPVEQMGGFVEVQRLRDAELASAALRALEKGGAPVVVILGNGHARADWGVPALIAEAAPDVSVASIGLSEDDRSGGMAESFDHVAAYPGVDRGDPCDRFRAQN